MKFHKLLVFMMVFSLAVISSPTFAQDDDDDDDGEMMEEEMDEEMWQAQMDEYTARKSDLTSQLDALNTEIDGLKKRLGDFKFAEDNANNILWAMVGSKSGYDEYKTKFADAEKRVNACKGPDDATDIETNLWPYLTDAGISGRYKCLPEFWDRYNAMKKKIADCKGKMETGTYTVVKGDCLYKIAGMKNIYGNSRLWPAIWDANKSGVVSAPPRVAKTIPNPNLIYPGQVLKIPTLTDAQKNDAMSRTNSYKTKRKMKTKSVDSGDMKKEDEKK
ncbi:MAG: LysM peptidoglycan-binding domain-containing protein [Ignavibacteria bacterium]|nr:LysM peptidoglycan-binding domain-containing protein [Ignavibacteria bacterium]